MFRDKIYYIAEKIKYDKEKDLVGLINDAYGLVTSRNLKPSVLYFSKKGLDLDICPNIMGYFLSPDKIYYVSLSLSTKDNQKLTRELTNKAIKYILDAKDRIFNKGISYIGKREPGIEVLIYDKYKKGLIQHLTTYCHGVVDGEGNNGIRLERKRKNKNQLKLINDILKIIGIKNFIWKKELKGKIGHLESNVKIGNYERLILTPESVLSAYFFLLEKNKLFRLEASNSNYWGSEPYDFKKSCSRSLKLETHELDVSLYSLYDPMEEKELIQFSNEFLDPVLEEIVFDKIGYDTRHNRQRRRHKETLKKVKKELHENKVKYEEIQKRLEKEYYEIFKEGRTEKEARSLAIDFAKMDFKYEIREK